MTQGSYCNPSNNCLLFSDGDISVEVEINPEQEAVWLTQKQMGLLFEVKQASAFFCCAFVILKIL